jgi:hypothetical protein
VHYIDKFFLLLDRHAPLPAGVFEDCVTEGFYSLSACVGGGGGGDNDDDDNDNVDDTMFIIFVTRNVTFSIIYIFKSYNRVLVLESLMNVALCTQVLCFSLSNRNLVSISLLRHLIQCSRSCSACTLMIWRIRWSNL